MMLDVCSWNNPGHNAYMGDVPSAISSYAIPASVSAKLKSKMLERQYDDVVEITKYGIEGQHSYVGLRNMHFGDKGKVCKTVDMTQWKSTDKEIGLVYCEEDNSLGERQDYCIIVPTVCRNVSQIDRLPSKQALKQFPATTQVTETFEQEATADPLPPVAFSLPEISIGETSNDAGGLVVPISGVTWEYFMGLSSFAAPRYFVPILPIPEPSTYFLTLLGLAAIGVHRWVRRDDKQCTLCGRVGHRASQCPWSKYK